MTRNLAAIALLLTALPIHAQTYKCKDAGGTTVFQQTPCADANTRQAAPEQSQHSIEPQCAALIASDTEYFRCAAEVWCDRSGSIGTTRAQCIEKKRQELQRDPSSRSVLEAERKAASEREKQRQQEESERAARKATESAEAEKP